MKQHLQQCLQHQENMLAIHRFESEHHQQYLEYFGELSKDIQNKQHLLHLLEQKAIRYHQQDSNQYLKIKIVGGSSTYEILEISVRLFGLSIPIQVLNIKGISFLHELQNISSTASSIYSNDQVLPRMVVKCFRYNPDYFTTTLTKVLKQYAILKIASTLKIAPPIKVLGGFDVFVYENCIEFSMQKCLSSSSVDRQYFTQLKLRLFRLHQLNIVHIDIKPQNITYSPSIDGLVFIDFGLSSILEENVGLKTFVGFSGSINYCSPEMFECYHSQNPKLIDLYYNDVFGLQATFKSIIPKNCYHEEAQIGPHDIIKKTHSALIRNLNFFYLKAKIKEAIYNCDSQVMNEQNGRQLILRKDYYFEYMKTLPYSFFLQKVNAFIKRSYQRDHFSSDLQSNKTRVQLYSIVNQSISADNAQTSKYSRIEQGIILSRKQFQTNNSDNSYYFSTRQILINGNMGRRVSKELFFAKSIDFIDFFISKSTLDERYKTAHNIVSNYGNPNSKQSELRQCLKLLLQHHISIKTNISNLTTIFNNLILVSDLEQNELENSAKQIVRYAISEFQDCMLAILRLFSSLFWVQQRLIISNFNLKRTKTNFVQYFNDVLNTLSISFPQNLQQISVIRSILLIAITRIDSSKQLLQTLNLCKLYIEKAPQLFFKWPILRAQVRVYYYNLILQFQLSFVTKNETIFWCVQGIDQQIGALRCRQKIGYYHISILSFFIKTKSIKGMRAISHRLQNCILNPEIYNNLGIYFQYLYESFQVYQHKSHQIYKNILEELKNDSQDKSRLLLYRVIMLFQFSKEQYRNLDGPIYSTVQQINKNLRAIFPLQILNDFKKIFQRYERHVKNSIQWCFLFMVVMIFIHQGSQQLESALECFNKQFDSMFDINNEYLVYQVIKRHLLYRKKKQKQLVDINRQIAQKCKARKDTFIYLMSVVKQSLELGVREARIAARDLHEWVVKNRAWEQFFKYSENSFNVVNAYLLQSQKIQQFLIAHYEFTSILRNYPTRQYISNYYISLITVFQKRPYDIQRVLFSSAIFQNKPKIDLCNPYSLIFYAVLLIDNRIQNGPRNIILSFVYRSIINVNTQAKMILRTHIYHCWIQLRIKNDKNDQQNLLNSILFGKNLRKSNYICKQYLKYPIHKVGYSTLQNYFLSKKEAKINCQKYLLLSLKKMFQII